MKDADRSCSAVQDHLLAAVVHDPALLAIARRWLETPDEAPPAVQRVLRCEVARARLWGRPYQPPSSVRLAELLGRQLHATRAEGETKLTSSIGATA